MADEILDSLAKGVRMSGHTRDQVLRELRSHLAESRSELEAEGRPSLEAEHESMRRFGDPIEIAKMLTKVHRRPTPRVRLILITTFVLAGISAAFGAAGTLAAPHPQVHHHVVTAAHRDARHRQKETR